MSDSLQIPLACMVLIAVLYGLDHILSKPRRRDKLWLSERKKRRK